VAKVVASSQGHFQPVTVSDFNQGGAEVRRVALLALLVCMLVPAVASAAEWYEKLKLKGDVRFRNELIQQTDKGDSFRWRIRARLVGDAEINNAWSATFGLASGSDDPVSTNQTLTGGFSRKPVNIDLAYVNFHPKRFPGMNLDAGKMRFPFETADKTQMVWDNDLTPEGIALKLKHKAGEKADAFMNAAGFYITDNDPDNEQWMSGAQAGFNVKPSGRVGLMAGASYFSFQRAKGMPGFYKADKFAGNSTMTVGTGKGYLWDFKEFEVLGTLDATVNDKTSLRFTGDYVNNTGADSLNTAYLVGGTLNYGKDKGSLKLFVNYRKIEADAVIGAFNYSDFIGGGTNGKGFELGFSVGLEKNASFDVTYLLNKKGIKESDTETDYKRLMVDIMAKF
jgi:hypothetical protein